MEEMEEGNREGRGANKGSGSIMSYRMIEGSGCGCGKPPFSRAHSLELISHCYLRVKSVLYLRLSAIHISASGLLTAAVTLSPATSVPHRCAPLSA